MSSLKLNQLLVTKGGKEVYNEKFHSGINIIRGHNSTGKSTILNFIFYALGGEFTSWLPEAQSCDYVIAELIINGRIITVKRDIDDKVKRPMSIFYGDLEKSKVSLFEGWTIHQYSKSASAESFSQVLFKFLDFPEISSDNQESITINQVLRLIYIDQLSALDSLMRNEDFDSPTIRQAIGYLLLGTYDDALLKLQMDLKRDRKELSEIERQLEAIEDVFKNSAFEFNPEKIRQQKQKNEIELDRVLKKLSEPYVDVRTNNETKKQIETLRIELLKQKKAYGDLNDLIDRLSLDVLDSEDFISVLEEKLNDINISINARTSFKDAAVSFCPVCLSKLDDDIPAETCHLCKKPSDGESTDSRILRMKLELEMQLKESRSLLEYRAISINEGNGQLEQVKRNLKIAQTNYDIFISQSRTTTESFYDKLLEQKGKLIADTEFLDRELALYESYSTYRVQKETLMVRISQIEDKAGRLQEAQKNKARIAFEKIQEYTLQLLKGDGTYEKEFLSGESVTVSFYKNSFYLDGRNRFSASSMVLLKNCVRFAIFFASVELDFFRYPKLILCDNIEDKGMEESRSRNFQKNIVEIAESERFKAKDFQMIFSTSMIDVDLNIEKYTIGPFYDDSHKSLKF